MNDSSSSYILGLDSLEKEIQLTARFVRSVIPHSGEIGAEVEIAFRQALRRCLPESIGVTSGFVADSTGNISKQLDIILYDKQGAVRLFEGDIFVLPAESTYAAGEVKTVLDRTAFHDSLRKCESFKRLNRDAQFVEVGNTLYGEQNSRWPPIFFVLAVDSGSQGSFHAASQEVIKQAGHDRKRRIDLACCLSGLMKVNVTADTARVPTQAAVMPKKIDLCATPEQDWGTYAAKRPWALFVSLLISVMTQVPRTRVNMTRYLGSEIPF
jgi:hypothetical protein